LRNALHLSIAVVLVTLAAVAALLASDVRDWNRALAPGPVRPASQWKASARVPGRLAERLLAVGDDVQARHAIQLFEHNRSVTERLDNAVEVTASRAAAETALAAVASGGGQRAAQAETLLGILAFGDLARGGGHDENQAEVALSDFTNAVRADPDDANAKFDLELVLRSFAAHGTRTGPSGDSGPGSTGRNGASNGTPGSGY
jgi:multidrug efflux pump subunit AcrA (membrane-fusion protein)